VTVAVVTVTAVAEPCQMAMMSMTSATAIRLRHLWVSLPLHPQALKGHHLLTTSVTSSTHRTLSLPRFGSPPGGAPSSLVNPRTTPIQLWPTRSSGRWSLLTSSPALRLASTPGST
jgi:hypothetical protein